MKLILLIGLLTATGAACSTNHVSSQQQVATPQASAAVPSSTAIPTISSLSTESPAEMPSQVKARLADRTAFRLDFRQMKKVPLAGQPLNIIKTTFFLESDSELEKKSLAEYAKVKQIYLLEQDLDNDGTPERITYDPKMTIIEDSYRNTSFESYEGSVHIFKKEKNGWKFLTLVNGDLVADENLLQADSVQIEFLSSGVKNDFAILKVIERMPNFEGQGMDKLLQRQKTVTYYTLQKREYEPEPINPIMEGVYTQDEYLKFYEEWESCPVKDEKIDESVPCTIQRIENPKDHH